mgnify:CR=1 FL=1
MNADALASAVSSALSTGVESMHRLSGGDVAEAFAMELTDGRRVFAKTHRRPPPHFFDTEARGLAWLHESGAATVPVVLAHADHPVPFLALAWIEEGPRSRADEADFGRRLAATHQAGAPAFGRTDRRTTGSRGLPNEPCETWADFYGSQRLAPLARLASDGDALPASAITALERLTGTLQRWDDGEPPSRLHGDLWAGNRLVDTDGRSWLIDPASHGGHREFDLAMMRLFGGFGDQVFDAYDEAHPLVDGWPERIALHQVAPLVVHAIKFGGGYVGAAVAAIEQYR